MLHLKFNRYVKKWSLTVGFTAMMIANIATFVIIDQHYSETTKWQSKYCTALANGRHELRVLVYQLSETTTNEDVKAELVEFLSFYPEIEC